MHRKTYERLWWARKSRPGLCSPRPTFIAYLLQVSRGR
jgi:hypothetical protein